jgi:pyruvate/2-oxoglutarate dehydrogenase complex dihydrolipoamide dehydrogenase (E3) component
MLIASCRGARWVAKGIIAVDDFGCTNVPGIYAVGDFIYPNSNARASELAPWMYH